jgi:hypothetical protein
MPRGGARPGSGRKVGSGRWGEATQVVRLPVSRIPEIQAWLGMMPRLGAELADLEPARPGAAPVPAALRVPGPRRLSLAGGGVCRGAAGSP